LKLPSLRFSISLSCPDAERGYRHAIDQFVDWYCSEPRLAFSKTVVVRYRMHLESRHLAPGTINLRLGAVRRLAYEAADCGLLSADLAAEQAHALWQAPDREQVKGKRDRAQLALLLACGFRRHELAKLSFRHLQQREGHWAIVDLRGKASRSNNSGSGLGVSPIERLDDGRRNQHRQPFPAGEQRGQSLGRGCYGKVGLARRQGVRRENWCEQTRSARSPAELRSPLSCRWRRAGADSVSARSCLGRLQSVTSAAPSGFHPQSTTASA
jgi:hypothetical protein